VIDQNDLFTRLGRIEAGISELVRRDEERKEADERQSRRIGKLEKNQTKILTVGSVVVFLLTLAVKFL
jgi:hypothetical protein